MTLRCLVLSDALVRRRRGSIIGRHVQPWTVWAGSRGAGAGWAPLVLPQDAGSVMQSSSASAAAPVDEATASGSGSWGQQTLERRRKRSGSRSRRGNAVGDGGRAFVRAIDEMSGRPSGGGAGVNVGPMLDGMSGSGINVGPMLDGMSGSGINVGPMFDGMSGSGINVGPMFDGMFGSRAAGINVGPIVGGMSGSRAGVKVGPIVDGMSGSRAAGINVGPMFGGMSGSRPGITKVRLMLGGMSGGRAAGITKVRLMLGGTSGGRRFSGLPSAREATVQEEDTSDGDDPNRPRPSSSSSSDGGGSVSHWEMSGQRHLAATRPGQKPRIAVLGTGWAASRLMKDLDTRLCDVVCVSPRNHMVFTPLLASTCVGTLEFRSVAEPIVRIQPALSASPDSFFFLGRCRSIDPHRHEIRCVAEDAKDSAPEAGGGGSKDFTIAYDKLVIAAGAQALTFNIHGVEEHAIFLREVTDAQTIRKKLLLNLMLSDIPGTSEEEKRRLLHCVVVGGGPTGVEFSGELSDFIRSDVHQRYSHVKDYINVTLIEAKEILSSFDVRLRIYAINHLEKAGVKLMQGVVKAVQPDKIILSDGSVVPYGLLVWSTGVGPSSFVKSLELPKSRVGRIGVDERLRVPGLQDVYAIGDCAGFVESVGKPDLPALAQVAERQGKYLAKELNRMLRAGGGRAGSSMPADDDSPPFVYRHLGSMASVGRYKALVDLRENKDSSVGVSWAGFLSWLVWRSAYLTRVVSWRNRFYVAVNWATTFVFGRDISRI